MSDLAIIKKDTVDVVAKKVRELQEKGEIHFPANYSAENAMKSAWLILQDTKDRNDKPALEVCTKDSIANALLDMVVQGLNPVKKQCYFIVYGKKLTLMKSYFGTMAATKRISSVEDVFAQVVYQGDEFEFVIENGTKRITKHVQKLENIDFDKIAGAYCTILRADGKQFTEIMNIAQIQRSWKKSKMNPEKEGSTHKEYPDQMAMRTVINRACKLFVNTSDDSDLVIESFNRSVDSDYSTDDAVRDEIKENANKEVIDITATPIDDPVEETVPQDINDEGPGF